MHIGLATLRRDGGISLRPDGNSGTLQTKVIRWPGGTLPTNVNAENGSLAITVKSPEGQTLTHSTSIVGDRLKTPVKLHGQPPQPGDTVSLEFTITNGDLYSFWWE